MADRFSRRDILKALTSLGTVGLSGIVPATAISSSFPAIRSSSPSIRLAFNENPIGPSEMAIEAIRKTVEVYNRYPDWTVSTLRDRLAGDHQVKPEMLVFGAGSTEIIRVIADTFLKPGDGLVVADPTYFQIGADASRNGASVRSIALTDDYRSNLDAMAAAITGTTRVVYICNPNNPTGTIVADTDLRHFLDTIPEGVLIAVDEAYHHYVVDPAYRSCIDYVKEGRNIVVLRTFSKAYALAGLRIGYGLAGSDIARKLSERLLIANVNAAAQEAAMASLDDTEHIDRSRRLNADAKAYLYGELYAMGITYIPSEANFILIDTQRDAEAIRYALNKRGILTSANYRRMDTFLRVSIGTLPEMEAFVAAIRSIFGITTGVNDLDPSLLLPVGFLLGQNRPNPFNSSTLIDYNLPQSGYVTLSIFDTLGHPITTLVNRLEKAGRHVVRWGGEGTDNYPVGTGVYFYRLRVGDYLSETRQMLLLR